MSPGEFQIFLSPIDTERFGVTAARALNVTSPFLESVLHFSKEHQVQFLMARCDMGDMEAVQAMEAEGFFLTDTLLYYEGSTESPSPATGLKSLIIRPLADGEGQAVQELAALSFHGYYGHYHADPRLNRDKCDEVYASWAYRSCVQRDVADEVFVAEKGNAICGFAAVKIHDSRTGEFILNAVHPRYWKIGVYSQLISQAKRLLFQRGIERIIISTQLSNVAVQKVWTREGFWLSHGFYTLHKWFD